MSQSDKNGEPVVTPEMEEAGREVAYKFYSERGPIMAAIYKAMLAAAPRPSTAAPVAWRYRWNGTGSWRHGDWKYVENEKDANSFPEYERQPLYAAPVSARSEPSADEKRLDFIEQTKCYPWWNFNRWMMNVGEGSKIAAKGEAMTIRDCIDATMAGLDGRADG